MRRSSSAARRRLSGEASRTSTLLSVDELRSAHDGGGGGGGARRRRSSFGEFGSVCAFAEVLAVAIGEFHLTEGNTLSSIYPPDFECPGRSHTDLGNLCVPDGGHLFDEDWTYGLLGEGIYAVACFMTRRDEAQTRGALQKSVLVLSRVPAFHAFEGPMRLALTRFLDTLVAGGEPDEGALRSLYACLNAGMASRAGSVRLWDQRFPFSVPSRGYAPLRFGGVSLVALLRRLGERTMVLWYALLLRHRVLFVGHGVQAREVGQLVLAMPLLVPSMSDFVLIPYVSFWDVGQLAVGHYVAGTTNKMLGMKTDMFDCSVALEGEARVTHQWSALAPAGRDLAFVREVLAAVDREPGPEAAEALARQRFAAYSANVLQQAQDGVAADGSTMSREQAKWLADYTSSGTFLRYQLQKPRMRVRRGAEDLTVEDELAPLPSAAAPLDANPLARPELGRKAGSASALLVRQASGRMDRRAMSALDSTGVRPTAATRIRHEAALAATAASGRVIMDGRFRLRDRSTSHAWSPWRELNVVLSSTGLLRYYGDDDSSDVQTGWVSVAEATSVGAAKAYAADRLHSVQITRSDGQLWVMTPLRAPEETCALWSAALADFCPTRITVLHSGEMAKRGALHQGWKRRFCQLLSDGELQYYKGELLKGSLQLLQIQSAQPVVNNPTKFELVTPGRTWSFDALTRNARDEWLRHLTGGLRGVDTTLI